MADPQLPKHPPVRSPLHVSLWFIACVSVGIGLAMLNDVGDIQVAIDTALIISLSALATTLVWWAVSRRRSNDPKRGPRLVSPIRVSLWYAALCGIGVASALAAGLLDADRAQIHAKGLASIGLAISMLWAALNSTIDRSN